MAWDFAAEIHSLANYNADDASTTGTSGEVLSAHATQWLTDGAKEIILQLSPDLLRLCTTNTTFTSQAAGSETSASLLNTGKILSVFAGSYSCRKINNEDKYKAEDSDNVLYATATDPAYYIERSYINVLPSGISTSRYEEVQYPTVAFSDSSIALFPDEAERLVVLYAAMKACLYQMNTFQTDTTIDTTALGAIATELNKADDIINTAHTQVGNFYTSIGDIDDTTELWDNTNKRFTEVKDALDNAKKALDDGANSTVIGNASYDAATLIAGEDTELVASVLSIASMELSRAGVVLSELNTIMASYSLELQGVPQYISTASGYISQAAGYVSEVQSRMGRANQKYTWYDGQYAKLSAEYARGLATVKGGG